MDLPDQIDVISMKEKDRIEWERRNEQQMEAFVRSIRLDLFALKSASIMMKMNEIEKEIKILQVGGEIDAIMYKMSEHNRLKTINMAISKELGERIILKM